jgi:hypothetical protein
VEKNGERERGRAQIELLTKSKSVRKETGKSK